MPSDKYLRTIARQYEDFDKLPPEIRATLREAYSEVHDPSNIIQYTRVSRFNPAALNANIVAQDQAKAQEAEAELRAFTAPNRAQLVADRAMRRARGRRW